MGARATGRGKSTKRLSDLKRCEPAKGGGASEEAAEVGVGRITESCHPKFGFTQWAKEPTEDILLII